MVGVGGNMAIPTNMGAYLPKPKVKVRAHARRRPATFQGKSMRLGGGGRFAKGVADLQAEGKSKGSAEAIMAAAGRKKYGAAKFAAMAAAGRKG